MKTMICRALVALALLALLTLDPRLSTAFAQGTAFTYQGRLLSGGIPAGGTYNFTFSLFTVASGGSAVAGPVVTNGVFVSNGLFMVAMDFGAGVWNGQSNWLEIGLETNGATPFTTLAPRQQLTPTPYAIYAESVTASGISGTLLDAQLLHDAVTINPGPGLSGGGSVALGNAITLSNTGVLSVTGNADITASTVNGVVTLGDTGTNTDTPNTLVKRDAGGNFSAQTLTLNGELVMPTITSLIPDVILSGSAFLLYDDNSGNCFVGQAAGSSITSGIDNTAVGFQAFSANTNGNNNTAIGYNALHLNSSGADNTADGRGALGNNTSGSENTGVGYQALNLNTAGDRNTAMGVQALFSNTNGTHNTAAGWLALGQNTSGSFNTASGYDALGNNTSGSNNTAYGNEALFNSTNSPNTALGYQALFSNTSGSGNTASGYEALLNNTSGIDNTASGYEALFNNTGGGNNTANGLQAMLNFTNGNYNTANGMDALYALTSGNQNTADGVFSLGGLTIGTHNTALGYEAGLNVLSGTNNIEIGTGGAAADNQTIRIGNGQTNTLIAGIFGATSASGVAVLVDSSGKLGTLTSSARFKQNIRSMGEASDVLLALHPVTFQYKPGIDPAGAPQFGLLAEQVEEVAPDLVVHDAQQGIYSVRYQAVDAMLLNEFLKQHRTVEAQEEMIQRQAAEVADLKVRLEKLETLIQSKEGQRQ